VVGKCSGMRSMRKQLVGLMLPMVKVSLDCLYGLHLVSIKSHKLLFFLFDFFFLQV